jgi:hypothetical protein
MVLFLADVQPLIRLFAIDSVGNLTKLENWSYISSTFNFDDQQPVTKRESPPDNVVYQALAFIGRRLFAIRKEKDTPQPFLVVMNADDIEIFLQKVIIILYSRFILNSKGNRTW